MNTYEKEAEDFLKKTKTKMSVTLLGHFPYFDGDKESRDVYEIKFERNGAGYTFQFGQSIIGSNKKKKPTAYDVLACVEKEEVGTFEDFCANFGYSDDSIKSLKLYGIVTKQSHMIRRMFSDVLEELREIQ